MENIGEKEGQSSGSKQKEYQEAYKEGKKNWKGGKDKNIRTTTHHGNIPTTSTTTITLAII